MRAAAVRTANVAAHGGNGTTGLTDVPQGAIVPAAGAVAAPSACLGTKNAKRRDPMSASESGYEKYVGDSAHMERYRGYQKKYASKMRESDRVLIDLLEPILAGRPGAKLVDVGCSTGNLLLHIRHAMPGLKLAGADLEAGVIRENGANPALAGIEFRVLNLLELGESSMYDALTLNAVLFVMTEAQCEQVFANVFRALRPGGTFAFFDFVHEFDERIEVTEFSRAHPAGLRITQRAQSAVRELAQRIGFVDVHFRPFRMPFDLPRPTDPADLTSYTVSNEGERLSFRGTLHQPWCHVIARKP